MSRHSDDNIVDAWHKNAAPWVRAVRSGAIDSRVLVTDRAVVEAVLRHHPESVLDIGCGEGWLVRALASRVPRTLGVDVVPELLARAREMGGNFRELSYAAIAAGALVETFDVVVCNFSLLGDDAVTRLIAAVPALLNPGGVFIVQTLHPLHAGDGPYTDGWRDGSWAGFSDDFSDPAPWYFRTVESWQILLCRSGFAASTISEPVHPETGKPASVIFSACLPVCPEATK